MKIEILGSGCQNRARLARNAQDAVKEKGVDCEVEKVTDIARIMACGIVQPPLQSFLIATCGYKDNKALCIPCSGY